MKVGVQGLWHLGSVTAACLASVGHDVVGLDSDPAVIDKLGCGLAPIMEPGLEERLKAGLAAGRLRFSSSPQEALRDVEVFWVTYDTPVDDDDNADVECVIDRVMRTCAHLPAGATVLLSSQLPVGSCRRLERMAARDFPKLSLTFACAPENLRLGKAVDCFLDPDRIVVGVRSAGDRERLSRLLGPVSERIEWMSVESAEMTKHAINAFLATSVTFSNEIASICELVGADAKEVERGLKTEHRIGPKAYLSPGSAFAGGTLARDITFLNALAAKKSLVTPVLSSVKSSNDEHKQWVKRKLQNFFADLSGMTVAVWGLTYKPGTDTLRRSMAVELCDWLVERGAAVRVHDPAAKDTPARWSARVTRCDDPALAVKGAQALVIATEWPEYRKVPIGILGGHSRLVVLDANRFVPGLAGGRDIQYVSVGTPGEPQ